MQVNMTQYQKIPIEAHLSSARKKVKLAGSELPIQPNAVFGYVLAMKNHLKSIKISSLAVFVDYAVTIIILLFNRCAVDNWVHDGFKPCDEIKAKSLPPW